MSEFNNRIDAQRQILAIVNMASRKEELYGLSVGAIDRWTHANGLDDGSEVVCAIREVAAKLFFLANKSQEQVTDEYRLRAVEVTDLALRIRDLVDAD